MRTRSKLLLTALVAAAAFTFSVSGASADELTVNTTSFYIKWNNVAPATKLTFEGAASTSCNVTLLGSFHNRTIRKVARTLVGVVTHARVDTCEPDDASILQSSLPWHVIYDGFTGRLPTIERVRLSLLRAAFLIQFDSIGECLAQTDAAEPASGEAVVDTGTGVIDGLQADPDPVIDVADLEGSFFCDLGGGGRFVGTGGVENGSGGTVVIRLI